MKKKYKITFEVDAHYPYVEKNIKKLSKDFDKWLKDWSGTEGAGEQIMPVLYEPHKSGAIEHSPNGTVRVKIVRDGEIILDTWWDVLSDDF